jgi:hypothetical protein
LLIAKIYYFNKLLLLKGLGEEWYKLKAYIYKKVYLLATNNKGNKVLAAIDIIIRLVNKLKLGLLLRID